MLAMVSVAVAMGYNVNKQELRPEECTAQPGGKTTDTTLLLGIKIVHLLSVINIGVHVYTHC